MNKLLIKYRTIDLSQFDTDELANDLSNFIIECNKEYMGTGLLEPSQVASTIIRLSAELSSRYLLMSL